MRQQTRWVFRILFVLSIIYHVWSYVNYGFAGGTGAFSIIYIGEYQTFSFSGHGIEILLVIIANVINYGIQIGLPVMFLYLGFIKK